VKEGEIRKEKPLPLVEGDEGPFNAPAGWEWVRVRQVTSDRGQTTPDKDFTYIDVTSINKEVGCVADAKILSAGEAPSRARKLVRTGDKLASATKKSPKSLMRMLGPKGNPQARNFFEIVAYLQKKEGLRLKVRSM